MLNSKDDCNKYKECVLLTAKVSYTQSSVEGLEGKIHLILYILRRNYTPPLSEYMKTDAIIMPNVQDKQNVVNVIVLMLSPLLKCPLIRRGGSLWWSG